MQTEAVPAESSEQVRAFEADGAKWTVTPIGATRSGSGTDRGAPLLLLRFEKEGTPEPSAREGLAVASSLDDLYDDDLAELLLRSRVVRSPAPPPAAPPSPERGVS
jgi:hypothetical protein